MDSSFDKVHTMQKHFCPVFSTTTSNSSVALLSFFLSFFPFSPCPQSSPSLLKGWQRDPWEIMNSDLSTEMADSALAIGNNNNKRYPWAFVNMNTVAEAWVQNINNAGRENKYCAHNGSFKWHAIKKKCLSDKHHQTVSMAAVILKDLTEVSLRLPPFNSCMQIM